MKFNVINQILNLRDMEVWELIKRKDVIHPFHVHGVLFLAFSRSNGPVPEITKGWKASPIGMCSDNIAGLINMPMVMADTVFFDKQEKCCCNETDL